MLMHRLKYLSNEDMIVKRLIPTFILLSLALVACKDNDGRNYSNYRYTKDYTTNLCFAKGSEQLAHVECTPTVLALIGEDEKTFNYVVDPQTELCFATGFESIANVPCSKEVKERIRE